MSRFAERLRALAAFSMRFHCPGVTRMFFCSVRAIGFVNLFARFGRNPVRENAEHSRRRARRDPRSWTAELPNEAFGQDTGLVAVINERSSAHAHFGCSPGDRLFSAPVEEPLSPRCVTPSCLISLRKIQAIYNRYTGATKMRRTFPWRAGRPPAAPPRRCRGRDPAMRGRRRGQSASPADADAQRAPVQVDGFSGQLQGARQPTIAMPANPPSSSCPDLFRASTAPIGVSLRTISILI